MFGYLRVGYNGDLSFQRRSTADQEWQVEHTRATSFPTFRGAATLAAADIGKRLKKPVVLLSGGVDSEVCARAFVDAGVPITCLIFRISPYITQDFVEAVQTAKQLELSTRIIELDLVDSQVDRMARLAGCPSPQLATLCLMLEKAEALGYSPILAMGDNELRRVDGKLMLLEREKEFSAHRFLARTGGLDSVPAFFQYSPELVLSRFQGYGAHVWRDLKDGNYEAQKLAFYQTHYQGIRQRPKLTGFEELGWQWDAERRLKLRRTLPANSETELLYELSSLCDYLSGKLTEAPTPVRQVAWSESPAEVA